MKVIAFTLVSVSIFLTPLSNAQDDAAIEAQEGDIDHWIEYYKKERGLVDPAQGADGAGSSITIDGEPDTIPARSDQTIPRVVTDSVQSPASEQ